MGLNHAEVGALVAKKWNFPEQLVAAIRFHHSPLEAPEDYRDVVFSVYLANCIADLERERIVHDQLDSRVLMDFGINEDSQLDRIQGRLAAAFEQQISRF
jgi:HD-like signal output (HDOD) protein